MLRIFFVVFCFLIVTTAFAEEHPAALGWSLQNVELGDLRLTDGQGDVQFQDGGLVFRLPPNQTKRWTISTTPIWPDWFPVAKTQYRIDSQEGQYAGRVGLLGNQKAPTPSLADPPVVKFDSETAAGQLIEEQHTLSSYQHLPVEEIFVELTSGGSPLTFRLFDLSILNPDIGEKPLLTGFPSLAPDETTPPPGWNYLVLPPSPYTLGDMTPSAADAPLELRGSTISGKLFELAPGRRVAATSLSLRDSITLEVNASGSDLFLLMGAHLIGKELHEGYSQRDAARSPDWLVVEKLYADGSVERSMPFSIETYQYEAVSGQWSTYHVPVDAGRTLRQAVIRDAMPFGQVYLAAATLNPGASSMSHIQQPDAIQTLPLATVTVGSDPQVSINQEKQIRISNQQYQITLETQDAFLISSLKHAPSNREFLQNPSPMFSVISNGLRVPDDDWRMAGYEIDGATVSLTLNNTDPALPLLARLFITPSAGDACVMRLRIENYGATPTLLRVLFPALQSLSIHNDASKDIHFLPTERAAWGRGAIELSAAHSGKMPQQWMDYYSDEYACGLSIQTRDLVLVPKQFRLAQSESGSRMGVDYGFEQPLVLQGGDWFETPLTLAQIHGGDWRTALASHREWLISLKPESRRENPIGDVFLCWRDYPYRGSGLIFNSAMNAYQFAPLVEELRREFGGVDMIELAGWMNSKRQSSDPRNVTTTGDPNNLQLGSEINLRRNIEEMESQDVYISLAADPFAPLMEFDIADYLLNGYKKDDVTLEHASVMEMNPNFEPWRRFAAHAYARRVQTLYGKVLYYDRIGLGALETLPGENALLRESYDELNQTSDRALYAERAPSDASTLHLDGALSYALAGGAFPTQLPVNILRFAQPQLRVMEKVHPSIYTHLMNAERAKLCVFQGVGLWLKGKPRSWYSQEFRQFVKDVYPIIRKHQDAFSSNDVEALLPTLRPGIFANRFSTHEKHVITLYNNTHNTIAGQLLTYDAGKASASPEWGLDDFSAQQTDDGVEISGRLHPKEVAVITIEPTQPDQERGTE